MKIYIESKDYYNEGEIIFEKKTFELQKGITVIVGANGTGKTTLTRIIESNCKKNNMEVFSYNNLQEGGSTAISRAGYYSQMSLMAQLFTGSEGENIVTNIGCIANNIKQYVDKCKEKKVYPVIIFDAIDSGLSIDNVIDIKEQLFETILNDCNDDVYIIVTANEYEMVSGENCLDCRKLKYRKFPTYNSFKKFILKSRELKDKRYPENEN